MKKIFSFVVILLMLASLAYAAPYGDSRIGDIKLTSRTVFNNATEGYGHTHITTSPTAVYRISYSSPTATTAVALYDSNTTGNYGSTMELINPNAKPTIGGNQFVKTCLMAVAANTQYTVTYDPPLLFNNGVLVGWPTKAMSTDYAAITVAYRQD